MLRRDEAHVWWVPTGNNASDGSELLWMLSPTEQGRRNCLAARGDKRDYAAAYALLRTTLSMYGRVSPDAWQFERGPFGKPHLTESADVEPLDFNLSHASGLVACAVARSMNVGIDVESLGSVPDCNFLYDRYLAETERRDLQHCHSDAVRGRFAELWTLKEALLKAVGLGLRLPPSIISFTWTADHHPVLVDRPAELRHLSLFFALYRPTTDHRMALVLESARTRHIVVCARGAHDGDELPTYGSLAFPERWSDVIRKDARSFVFDSASRRFLRSFLPRRRNVHSFRRSRRWERHTGWPRRPPSLHVDSTVRGLTAPVV
jgi:4'-phosphopantetheinyl transferase